MTCARSPEFSGAVVVEILMLRPNPRLFVAIVLSLVLWGCAFATEPHSDVDVAREAWLELRPMDYTFEVSISAFYTPHPGYYQVRVADRQVVEARDPSGAPLDGFTLSIDELWDRLLAARANGELNSVLFNGLGVPIETDMGPWELDGGVHYSVRRFVRGR